MEVLSVINGVVDEKLKGDVEKYAFLKGLLAYELKPGAGEKKIRHRTIMVFVDQRGMERYRDAVLQLKNLDYPVILLSDPCTFEEFQKTVGQYVDNWEMEERRLCFGQLLVDRIQHRIVLEGEEIKLGPYEFDILIFMLEHIGKVMTRKEMNYLLPERKRGSMRNIDTHIKNIRRLLHMKDVIKCVRSVGYRIEQEDFYREMAGKTGGYL